MQVLATNLLRPVYLFINFTNGEKLRAWSTGHEVPCKDQPQPRPRPQPIVQKPINANPRLNIYQCCSTLIFGKNFTLEEVILKNKNKTKKLSPKS